MQKMAKEFNRPRNIKKQNNFTNTDKIISRNEIKNIECKVKIKRISKSFKCDAILYNACVIPQQIPNDNSLYANLLFAIILHYIPR